MISRKIEAAEWDQELWTSLPRFWPGPNLVSAASRDGTFFG